jgi:hypothetical protein
VVDRRAKILAFLQLAANISRVLQETINGFNGLLSQAR